MTADSTALCVNEGLPGDANRRRVVRGAVRVLLGPPPTNGLIKRFVGLPEQSNHAAL